MFNEDITLMVQLIGDSHSNRQPGNKEGDGGLNMQQQVIGFSLVQDITGKKEPLHLGGFVPSMRKI